MSVKAVLTLLHILPAKLHGAFGWEMRQDLPVCKDRDLLEGSGRTHIEDNVHSIRIQAAAAILREQEAAA